MSFEGMTLQIPADEYRHHYVRTSVQGHRYVDDNLTLFLGRASWRAFLQKPRKCKGWPRECRSSKPSEGGKAASGYALHRYTAIAIQSIESGQSTCYQIGQFYLLLIGMPPRVDMKNTKKMQALDENGSRSVPHDTAFIRASFRKLIRSIVLVSAVLLSAHGAVFLGLGDPVWKVCVALVVAAAPLYYMTGPQRGFSAFLAGTLALLALLFFYVTYMVAHMGSESGFQYLILVAIPIVIVAGRIGLLSKWLIVVGMVLYLLALDSGMVVTTPAIPFALDVTMGFHAFNIALVALVLGVGAQRHFIVMSERQSLLFQQASIDPLTGLFNRRGLFEVADGNVARARRFGSPLAVILGDVDLFKQVNDQHGHTIGDAVLRQVGAALKEVARDYDSVCRWGGEEFLIVLPETTLTDAAAIAERIRVRFASKPLRVGTTHQVVTMTMGVAQLDSFELLEGTIHRADQSLYIGKRQGRNQVVLAT